MVAEVAGWHLLCLSRCCQTEKKQGTKRARLALSAGPILHICATSCGLPQRRYWRRRRHKEAEEDELPLAQARAAAGGGRAVATSALVAGSNLNPRKGIPFRVEALEDSRGDNTKPLGKKMSGLGDAASPLLVQAVQSTQDAKRRKKRKKEKDKNDRPEAIGEPAAESKRQGREKEEEAKIPKGQARSRRVRRRRELERVWVNSTSSSRGSDADQEGSEADSDLSSEAPLRKRATKEPGSVLRMLVRHLRIRSSRA